MLSIEGSGDHGGRSVARWWRAAAALVLLLPVLAEGPAGAQSTENAPSVGGFDASGLETVVLASFDAGDSTTLWSADGSRWGASGSLVEGDVSLDDATLLARVMVPSDDGSLLRLNDSDGVKLRDFFGISGDGADLTVWIHTAEGTVSFPASAVRSAGSDYVNFDVPTAARAVVSGIASGDRFVLALARPNSEPEIADVQIARKTPELAALQPEQHAAQSGATEPDETTQQSGPAEQTETTETTEQSDAAPESGLVLSGVVAFGSGVSGESTYVGYSSPSRPGGPARAGGFEPASWDAEVVRVPSDLYALAQMEGAIASGPAESLSDPVVLRLAQSVDLASGFILEVDGNSLFSAAAVDPAGHEVSTAFRYWMWDAPCVNWQLGDQAQIRLYKLEADDDRQGAHTDTALSSLAVDGADLDETFDPSADTHHATATAHTRQVSVSAAAGPFRCAVNIDPPDADSDADGHQVNLDSEGNDTVLTVAVTAADNAATAHHTLTITREEPMQCTAGADANLSSLNLSVGNLSPAFNSAINTYQATAPHHTGQITIAAEPASAAVPVDIFPTDANLVAPGTQIDLAAAPDAQHDGTTTVTVTVNCANTYTITITRPPATAYGRITGADIDIGALGLDYPNGIWSDGTTMWVANMATRNAQPGVWAVDLESKSIVGEHTYSSTHFPDGDAYPTDAWSNGEVMWVLHRNCILDAFDVGTQARLPDRDLSFCGASTQIPGLQNAYGMWSDGETMWIAVNADRSRPRHNPGRIIALDLLTGVRQLDKEVPVPGWFGVPWWSAGVNSRVNDIWSDGTIMWVVYRDARVAMAFDLSSGERRAHLDFDTLESNGVTSPRGIWSDGGVVWFGTAGRSDDLLIPMYLPIEASLTSIAVNGAQVDGFGTWVTDYSITQPTSADTITVSADAYHPSATITMLPEDADAGTEGHQVNLTPGVNTITITSGTRSHTMTHTLRVTREAPPRSLHLNPRHGQIVVVWDVPESDLVRPDGYVVQWRTGSEPYDTTRQIVAPRPLRTVIGSVAIGTLYDIRVSALDAEGRVIGSIEDSVSPQSQYDYIEREVIEVYEEDRPWVRWAWDVPLRITVNDKSVWYAAIYTSGRSPSGVKLSSGVRWPGLWDGISIDFARRYERDPGLVLHELGHHYTLDRRMQGNPASVAAGWMYFERRQAGHTGQSSASEVYANHLRNTDPARAAGTTHEATALTRSVAIGEMPQWLYDTYSREGTESGTKSEASLDLDLLWAAVRDTPHRARVAYGFRDSFGGFCSDREALDALGDSVLGNPWVDGGCDNRRPQNLTAESGTDSGEIDVSWSAQLWSTAPAIDSYVVQWKTGTGAYNSTDSATLTDVTDLTDLSHTVTGLATGSDYSVRIAAVASSDVSDFTDDDGHDRTAETTATAK